MQKVEQSLEVVDLGDQPQNWSLNPATGKTVVPVSFCLLRFSAIWLSVNFCGTELIPDNQPKYLRVALARSGNYQQCVEGGKQKLWKAG